MGAGPLRRATSSAGKDPPPPRRAATSLQAREDTRSPPAPRSLRTVAELFSGARQGKQPRTQRKLRGCLRDCGKLQAAETRLRPSPPPNQPLIGCMALRRCAGGTRQLSQQGAASSVLAVSYCELPTPDRCSIWHKLSLSQSCGHKPAGRLRNSRPCQKAHGRPRMASESCAMVKGSFEEFRQSVLPRPEQPFCFGLALSRGLTTALRDN
jgi:hypothetical protein